VTCPFRELTNPRVGSPRVGISMSCPVTALSVDGFSKFVWALYLCVAVAVNVRSQVVDLDDR